MLKKTLTVVELSDKMLQMYMDWNGIIRKRYYQNDCVPPYESEHPGLMACLPSFEGVEGDYLQFTFHLKPLIGDFPEELRNFIWSYHDILEGWYGCLIDIRFETL